MNANIYLLLNELLPEELEYAESAIQAGVQSTEILNVLVITRCTMQTMRNLVGAMENHEFIVYPINPRDVQTVYTIMKIELKKVNQRLQLLGKN